ncbi:thrombospondin-1 [Aplysia californica]|uniref:Thrombospondin-1 n=1 Tax=Aplysia californica TaxID=6500 RepID=A0ABM0JRC1_APLCA|nr:thrombospondin-1 [Aplysia californica]
MWLQVRTLAVVSLVLLVERSAGQRSKGQWGEWSRITPCSVTCGSGTQKKVRVWIPGPGEPARKEPYTSSHMFTCRPDKYPHCPTDGHWSEWWYWSDCTRMCGGGTRHRERECVGVTYNGKECDGEPRSEEKCNREPCPPLPRHFDMRQCVDTQNYTCASGKMCVPSKERCDGDVHCHDGSDEQNCPRAVPGPGRVRYGLSMGRNGVAYVQGSAAVVMASVFTITAAVSLCH